MGEVGKNMKHGVLFRGTSQEIMLAATQMRHEMTPGEKILWCSLKGKKLDRLKFRAQHPVGRFILDFYCPICKLAVEVDGDIHNDLRERDEERTSEIEGFGYKVIRFTNEEILTDLQSVLRSISTIAAERLK
jgi:very-short-patch-repair endonuclease